MKLLAWEGNVLASWSGGLIVALAEDREAAVKMARRQISEKAAQDMIAAAPTQVIDLGPVRKRPRIWHCWGSD